MPIKHRERFVKFVHFRCGQSDGLNAAGRVKAPRAVSALTVRKLQLVENVVLSMQLYN